MPIESSPVAPGDEIQAAQFNKLRNDVLINHTHQTGQGGVVSHGDLVETDAIPGTYHTHEQIRQHMMGAGTEFTDSPGGSAGVHGLSPSASVLGFLGYVTEQEPEGGQAASPSLDSAQWSILVGRYIAQSKNAWVNFGLSFDQAPIVVVTPLEATPRDTHATCSWTSIIEQSRFELWSNYVTDAVFWMALGPYSG